MGRIRAAKVENSPRLQRFLEVLQRAKRPMSTVPLQIAANIANAHTCAAELRAQGVEVNVERKGDYYFYSLPALAKADSERNAERTNQPALF